MTSKTFFDGRAVMHNGDSRDVLKSIPDASIDSVCTDPPYALVSITKRFGAANAAPGKDVTGASGPYTRASAGFMGQQWDTGETAFAVTFWAEVFRVLKPGGHVIAFSGTRTYHRLAVAIEDAGFEIRDQLAWCFGTGFPKSHNVAKGIEAREKFGRARTEDMRRLAMGEDYQPSGRGRVNYDNGGGSQMNGEAEGFVASSDLARKWAGWGTALKPAWEPIVLARKPLIGTVVENVLAHGTGGINIGACRIEGKAAAFGNGSQRHNGQLAGGGENSAMRGKWEPTADGRFPTNLMHDGSPEVLAGFPETANNRRESKGSGIGYGSTACGERGAAGHDDSGSAARFFYCAKASKKDRAGSKHPTVKPVALMRWLVRLVTPEGGTVLEPFAGSGSTLQAAIEEGASVIGIERETNFFEDCCARLDGTGGLARERREANVEGQAEPPEPVALPPRRKRGDPHPDQSALFGDAA